MRHRMTMMVCLVLFLQHQSFAQAPASPGAPSAVPSKPLASGKSAKSLQPLIEQAQSALNSGDYKAARDTFSDVLTIDPKNPAALSGLGMSYVGLKDYAKATPLLDKAVAAKPSDRVLVYNAAAAHLGAKNAMRAAKLLKEYLEAHPKDADEPMANALAIALNQADDQAKKNSFYQIAAGFYKTYNAKLEAAASGLKRWGIDWYSAEDVTQKIADAKSKHTEADDIAKEFPSLDSRLDSLKADLPNLQQRAAGGEPEPLEEQKTRIDELQTQRNDRQKAYVDALAAVPRPSYPPSLDPVTAETLAPATVIAVSKSVAPTTVADATRSPIQRRPRTAVRPRRTISTPGGDGTGPSTPNSNDPPIVIKGSTNQPETPTAPVAPEPEAPIAPVRRSAVVQYAAAFPIAADLVVTAAAPLEGATKIELLASDGGAFTAQLVRADEATGLALLRLTDRKMSFLSLATDFKGGAIQCAAFPSVNIFNPAAELLTGTAPAPAGGWKVRLAHHPRLPGAPLLVDGKVVGVQLATRDAEPTQLPAATLEQLKAFLATDLPTAPGTGTAVPCMLQLSATKGSP